MWKEIIIPLIFLIIGWGFGILQTLIININERNRKIKDITSNLLIEFKEVMPRLIFVFYHLINALGILRKEDIDWILKKIQKYPLKEGKITDSINKLSNLKDEEIKNFSENKMDLKEKFKSVGKFHMPILKSSIDSILYLEFQAKIIEINNNFEWLNEKIEDSNTFSQKTFEPGLSNENYEIVNKNYNNSLYYIAELSKTTADCIDDLVTNIENKRNKIINQKRYCRK